MQQDFRNILDRYKAGTATEQDIALLESWYLQYGEDGENGYAPADQVTDALSVWEELQSAQPVVKRFHLWPRIAAAASILLCLSIGGYFILHKKGNEPIVANNLINPAGNKAILHLANGKSITLAGVKTGYLIQQPNAIINKIAEGTLLYKGQPGNNSTAYDTLTTLRGGHFQLILADGTKAWLNAATIIRYPENFSGNERRIELVKGEAYFEVVHNSNKPFKVIAKGQVIEDIGTHFNVNAYADEPAIETTLLEGSVSVTGNKQRVVLVPGQRSYIKNNGSPIIIEKADLGETVAWKDNHFVFNGDDIESIMRQLSRWYDVDVTYQGDMSGKEITGSVSRSENIAEVLRKLEETGTIHFKLEGRKVTVMP